MVGEATTAVLFMAAPPTANHHNIQYFKLFSNIQYLHFWYTEVDWKLVSTQFLKDLSFLFDKVEKINSVSSVVVCY